MILTLPKLTMVIGGAASGKSVYAENLVITSGHPRSYIATAQALDNEMRDKVVKHKAQRGADWDTYEAPFKPWEALAGIDKANVTLLDCATFWLSNMLINDANLAEEKVHFLNGLKNANGSVVIVTNEVGQGVVPDNKLARQFRQAQGELNQDLAALCDLVVLITAGLPLSLKGQLPQVTP
ncbi:bifunctional adenosylcobinamide kinase/adenosylcobinamide-phosphate guanylyltransferase [Amylibacter sp. SFDW26]|uniref:bifunctional adenosylcobinamide kinase/adenosylcobinamide-phosphate guanylyltransferase n=1 Tax=Amylibacter sp. SFDW26 TaxID=2652722 RepID=UPI0012624D5F|nr:bifunctional adenosylcobinamide kinase/adenosylcobinamide-phosphate guanylyltransferase [Amylibacter sp. SFDW26]KAB7613325.1 bifunctional adenosylcobinamide kinase/adenosylcobinamide-phosphate guanylyltransferase [Amylibacter sp. SFDW26]